MGDRITKAMPAAVMGKDVPLKEIFDPEHKRLRRGRRVPVALRRPTTTSRRVVDTAIGIEGLKRQWGVHAAGVIMSSEPLLDVIPLLKRPADGAMITQFDYPTCEALGLIKMDFLGLRNLTVLDDAVNNIEANRGETVVLEELELDRRGDLPAAPARRHPRRLPARRRPDAGAAALDAARLLRGHLRGRRALPARPDGRRLPQQVRPPQDRPRAGRARSTPSWPSRSRRSSARPTA